MEQIHKSISAEQKKAFDDIIKAFALVRSVILLAQMQSGKTDTYMFVAFELLRRKLVKNVVIMAGFQDKELVEQLIDTKPAEKRYRRYMNEVLQLSFDDIEEVEELYSRIEVISGAMLNKQQFVIAKDTLFIWDESHYAQNKFNRPSHFMKMVGISANGDATKFEGERNNYFLSVSATPLSELSDAIHERQSKQIVRMEPGDGYVSVSKLYENKQIIKFSKWQTQLFNGLQSQMKKSSPSYSIIRVRGDKKMEEAKKIAEEVGINYEVYDAKEKLIAKNVGDSLKMQSFEVLKQKPTSHKAIFIRGLLRMGKRIHKEHISFVMETSINSKTDVLLQGLLGRMCGYHTYDNFNVFIHEKWFKRDIDGLNEPERYIKMMTEVEEEVITTMPLNGANLKTKDSHNSIWNNAVPIVIEPIDSDVDSNDDPDYECYAKDKIRKHILRSFDVGNISNGNDAEATKEIQEQIKSISDKDLNIHALYKRNNTICKTFEDMPELLHDAVLNKVPILNIPAGCGFGSNVNKVVNVWCVPNNSNSELFRPGTFIIHARTLQTFRNIDDIIMQRKIPVTTKNEVFTREHEDGTSVSDNGTYSIPMPTDTWNSVENMKECIEKFIDLSMKPISGFIMPRCITSNRAEGSNWKGILVNDVVLKSLKENGDVSKYIHNKYKFTLQIAKMRGRIPIEFSELNQTRLAKISW